MGSVICDELLEVFLQKFLVHALRHEHCIDHVTEEQCFSVSAWSLNILAEGIWPHADPDGVPWRKNTFRARQAGNRLTLADNRGYMVCNFSCC